MKKFDCNTLKRFILVFVLICILSHSTAFAEVKIQGKAQKKAPGKVIMFIMDNINYDDITNYGGNNLQFLVQNGALGLMNVNSGGSFRGVNSYATIGAGNYAVSSPYSNYSGGYSDLLGNETINTVYLRNTGKNMYPENIAYTEIINMIRENQKLDRPIKVGLLGSLLNEGGFKTALIGNESTTFERIKAHAALITMNDEGITNFGNVSNNLLKKDPMSPYGIKTDYNALFDAYTDVKDKADLIVIQSGDTSRLDSYKYYSDEMYVEAKDNIFKDVDIFLGNLIKTIDEDSILLFVVPFPPSEDIAIGKKLTPVMAYGKMFSNRVLFSSTTKRDGIITNTDITAHIIDFFELEKEPSMIGHELSTIDKDMPLKFINDTNTVCAFNYINRPAAIRVFILFIIATLLFTILFAVYFKKYLIYMKPVLTGVMITPMAFLLISLFNPTSATKFNLLMACFITVFGLAIAFFLKDNLSIFTVTLLTSTLLILIDTFMGSPLARTSILSYDPIVGARFYGIGNEFMGFLLGSTIIGTASLIDKYRKHHKLVKLFSIILLIVVLVTLALPSLGTNVGGTIAAFIGFGIYTILLFKEKITTKDITFIGILLFVMLLALFIYDGMQPAETQSHIGQTSSMVKQSSIISLIQVFKRKLLMNYKLIRYSTWTWALLAIITALVILFRWPVGILKEIFRRHRYLYSGFIGGIVGALAAFVFNDSGVVAAAMSMLPISIPLILLCVDEMHERMV